MSNNKNARIENRQEVQAYIQNLKFALENGAVINVQLGRRVDKERDERNTNDCFFSTLFPDERPRDVVKRELATLSVNDYIRTVKDTNFPKLSEWREFGKIYNGEEVYIKIRVELLAVNGDNLIFVMSFHFAEYAFTVSTFPYR